MILLNVKTLVLNSNQSLYCDHRARSAHSVNGKKTDNLIYLKSNSVYSVVKERGENDNCQDRCLIYDYWKSNPPKHNDAV
jgi:hypothetical protein